MHGMTVDRNFMILLCNIIVAEISLGGVVNPINSTCEDKKNQATMILL